VFPRLPAPRHYGDSKCFHAYPPRHYEEFGPDFTAYDEVILRNLRLISAISMIFKNFKIALWLSTSRNAGLRASCVAAARDNRLNNVYLFFLIGITTSFSS
jgi:hypothetical protein